MRSRGEQRREPAPEQRTKSSGQEVAREMVDAMIERNDGSLEITAEREEWERAAEAAQDVAAALYKAFDVLAEMEANGDAVNGSSRIYQLQGLIDAAVGHEARERKDWFMDNSADDLSQALGNYIKNRFEDTREQREQERMEWWSKEGYALRHAALVGLKTQLQNAPDHTLRIERPDQLTENLKLVLSNGRRLIGIPFGSTFMQVGRTLRLEIKLEESGELTVINEQAQHVTDDYDPESPMHTWPMKWERSGGPRLIHEQVDVITVEQQRAAYARLTALASEERVEWISRSQIPKDVEAILKRPDNSWNYFPLLEISENSPVSVSLHGNKLSLVEWNVVDERRNISNIYEIQRP